MEAEAQRVKMESTTEFELKQITSELRSEVIQKENELSIVSQVVKELKHQKKSRLRRLTADIHRFEKNYNELQSQRSREVKDITRELKKLRDMISDVENHIIG